MHELSEAAWQGQRFFFCDVLLSSLKWHKFVAPEAQQCGFRHISYIFAHYMYTCAYKNTTMSDK